MKNLRSCALILAFMVGYLPQLEAQQITLSIPDTIASAGSTVLMPVVISGLSQDIPIVSGQGSVSLTNTFATVNRIRTDGTLLDGQSVFYNATTKRLAFTAPQGLTDDGILLYLEVQIRDDAARFQQTTMTLTDVLLNETVAIIGMNAGSVTVRGIAVSPSSFSQPVVAGTTVQFAVTGNPVPPLTWSTTDATRASIDENGLLQALSPGNLRVFITDASGQRDSTALFRIVPETLNELTLSVSSISVFQTLVDTVYVRVSDLTGLGITSGQFSIDFPSTQLELLGLVQENTILTSPNALSLGQEANRITAAFAQTSSLNGEGNLLGIRFRVRPQAQGNAVFSLSQAQFNENLTPELQSGTVAILSAPVIELVPETASMTIGDTLQYGVLSGGNAPYRFSSSETAVAQIDSLTGVATALSRGTVTIRATDRDGFSSPARVLRVNDVTVSVGEGAAFLDEVVSIPIVTEDITGLGVLAIQLEVDYDTTVAVFQGIDLAGGIADGAAIFSSSSNGKIRVAIAATQVLQGEGVIAVLSFVSAPGVSANITSELGLIRADFNEPGMATPTATLQSGRLHFLKKDDPVPDPETTMELIPSTDGVFPSEQFHIDILVGSPESPAVDLRSVGLVLNFDANAFDLVSIQRGELLAGLEGGVDERIDTTTNTGQVLVNYSLTDESRVFPEFGQLIRVFFTTENQTGAGGYIFFTSDETAADSSGAVFIVTGATTSVNVQIDGMYPGDANRDGIVDAFDVLPLATWFMQTGPPRPASSITWDPQLFTLWDVPEATFADTNGDGVVNQNDLLPVGLNFGKTTPEFVQSSAKLNRASEPVVLTLPDLQPGDQVMYEVVLGSDRYPMQEIRSIAMNLAFDTGQLSLAHITPVDWTEGSTLLQFNRYDTNRSVHSLAVSRMNGVGLSRDGSLVLTFTAHKPIAEGMEVLLDRIAVHNSVGAYFYPMAHFRQLVTTSNAWVEIPAVFELSQNYPNPFNPTTTIQFSLSQDQHISLDVFTIMGQRVATLVEGVVPAGEHRYTFNASGLSSGAYIYRLQTETGVLSRYMMLVK